MKKKEREEKKRLGNDFVVHEDLIKTCAAFHVATHRQSGHPAHSTRGFEQRRPRGSNAKPGRPMWSRLTAGF